MRAVFFGTYNRGHSANRIALAAVRAAGYEVVEIHDPLWERTRDKHASYFSPASLAALALRWMASAWRLARTWRQTGGAPVAVVGFNGQLDVLLLRLLCRRYGPRIVFAPLVSLTETLVDDRRVYASGSPAARLLRLLDRATCRAADTVIVDTEEHRLYFVEELGIDPSRLLVCHLGSDPEVFLDPDPVAASEAVAEAVTEETRAQSEPAGSAANAPAGSGDRTPIDVLWFGQYLPLHGLDVVSDAVGRLAARGDLARRLRFTFVGDGEQRLSIERNLRATRADVHFVDWIAYEDLAGRIARADIVLGIFGSSRKARMVVPNKVYEAAAVGRAIITADTPALHEVFEDGVEVVACAADGRALADAIEELADPEEGRARREALGRAARRRMLEGFSAEALGRAWSVALAGPEALSRRDTRAAAALPRVGVAVLCFQDARAALACLHSVVADGYPDLDVLVVDNGSTEAEHDRLVEGIDGRLDAEVLRLDHNRGYAGANNVAMRTLFERGCEYVLLLNSDTLVAPGTVAALVREARRHPEAAARGSQRRLRLPGPLGPRVTDGRPGTRPVSLGERFRAPLLWAPRSLVRVRARRQRPYPVSGVTGCAMLMPRVLFERVGGFDETLFAYYEEVDLCLRARDMGFVPTVVPEAEVGHAGARGFASGMTPLAAFLKARNLHNVGMKHVGPFGRILFIFGYHPMVMTSALVYALRGRIDVTRAMLRGLASGMRAESGPPPEALFAQSGYEAAGLGADETDRGGGRT